MSGVQKRLSLSFRGHRVWVCCHYRRVLEALDALEDAALFPVQRVDAALSRLVRPRFLLRFFPAADRTLLLNEVMKRLTYFPSGSGEKVIDFTRDFGYIYAAFLPYYGIDLVCRRVWLSWKQFCYLLLSLPADAKLSQIAAVRSKPLPDRTAANAEQVDALRRAKRFFALDDAPSRPMDGLAVLFSTFSCQE